MELEIVSPVDADFPEVLTPVLSAFGMARLTDDELADERIQFDDYRMLAGRAEGRWVGNVADFPFELTLPGGATVPAAGVTMVGVLPSHRRRGVTSRLMARLLDDAAARGEPVAVLLASESGIYGRFGFGVATLQATVHIATAESAFLVDPAEGGEVRLEHDPLEATRIAEQVWERHRSWRPGTLSRRPWTWEHLRLDREGKRGGASAFFYAVHTDAGGEPDGFAAYRVKERDDDVPFAVGVTTRDLFGVDADVEAALVRFLCDLDLVRRVDLGVRPVDDPLRWRLRDSRQLVVDEFGDFLWARVIDVPAALSARRYASEDRFVLQVDDAFRPASGGRFLVAGGATGATCVVTDEPADLTLGADALGSLLLGTVAPSVLAGAGRITAEAGALRRADAFFASSPAPFSCTRF